MMTDSMFPLLPAGTLLFFVPPGEVAVGDIVVNWTIAGWRCHRLVSMQDGECVTWGDWTLEPDATMPLARIGGKCVIVHRKNQVLDMEWPLWQLLNRLVAMVLPACKKTAVVRLLVSLMREQGHDKKFNRHDVQAPPMALPTE